MKEMRDEIIKNETEEKPHAVMNEDAVTEEKPHAVMNEDAVTEEKPHAVMNEDYVTEEEFLAAYRPGDYEKPSVAVDMAIFSAADKKEENYRKLPEKELRLLMIRRGGHPFKGHWALPGGFVEPDENTESAAARELMEETGVDNIYLEQLYTFSDPHRDPRTWVMSCSYLALVDSSKINVEAGDDAERASWFSVRLDIESRQIREYDGGFEKTVDLRLELKNGDTSIGALVRHTIVRLDCGTKEKYEILENDGIAFDHAKIITYAILRLRGKVQYTDIALNLVPEYFTLTQLQQIYEIILGKPLIKAAFRRKYGILAEPTEMQTSDAGHRPSQLFRRKWLTE